jgi:hypothetical protein
MKKIIYKLIVVVPLMLIVAVGLASCEDKEKDGVFYVVGYDVQSGINIEGEMGVAGVYLLVSEDLKDTIATNNLPNHLFAFPAEIVKPINICGFTFFSEKYRYSYNVKMTYMTMNKEEKMECNFICPANFLLLHHINPKYVIIKSISKI